MSEREELIRRLRRMAPKVGGSVGDDMREAADALAALNKEKS